jgi:hypothetical protein
LGLLLDGRITALKATAVTEASYVLPDDRLPGFEERVLKCAPEQTLRQLRDVVKRAQLRIDPASAEQRTQRAREDRSVRVADAGDGMAWLTALLPAEQALACMQRVDAAARMAPAEDQPTVEQRRADVLVDAILGGLSGELPAQHGLQPTSVSSSAWKRWPGSRTSRAGSTATARSRPTPPARWPRIGPAPGGGW